MNAGQANAATGELGYQDSLASADAVAAALGLERDDVLLESTGVIGRRIKMDALLAAVPTLAGALGEGAADAHRAAVAITTTDLVSKSAALEVELSPGRTVRLGGIAKGSGMIHPNMCAAPCCGGQGAGHGGVAGGSSAGRGLVETAGLLSPRRCPAQLPPCPAPLTTAGPSPLLPPVPPGAGPRCWRC